MIQTLNKDVLKAIKNLNSKTVMIVITRVESGNNLPG